MRILIVSDAWYPQVNGVVRTLDLTGQHLTALGHEVHMLSHEDLATFPVPTYPEIRLAVARPSTIARKIEAVAPDCIHIATEGTLGWMARRYCLKNNLAFTTSFHSRFPEMIAERLPVPGIANLAYSILRRFHAPARCTLAPTKTVTQRLTALGFHNVNTWTRGVDRDQFRPLASECFANLARPIMLNAGRVAVEKNLRSFLDLTIPGTKVIVGDGPQLAELKADYPDVMFTGYLFGEALCEALTEADVFVFPSQTDTFGLVMLEALSCGTPVAAYPVEGPIDVITSDDVGALDHDLAVAIKQALTCKAVHCIAFAEDFSWKVVATKLAAHLVRARPNGGVSHQRHETLR